MSKTTFTIASFAAAAVAATALFSAAAGCAGQSRRTEKPGQAAQGGSASASVTIEPKSGSTTTGTATFTAKEGKVTLVVEIAGAPAGDHAVHIHEKADCSSPDAKSAGEHWNPTVDRHGKWGTDHYHLGDIGNITVDSDGRGRITLTTDQWTIGTGQPNDITGHSIVVHASADDFQSQPAGNAGTRIGCGVIKRD